MKANTCNLKTRAVGAFAAVALAFSVNAKADLIDGIVDVWNVNVDTIFDTTSIVDSNGNSPGGVTIVNDQSLRWGTSTGSGQSGLDITRQRERHNQRCCGRECFGHSPESTDYRHQFVARRYPVDVDVDAI